MNVESRVEDLYLPAIDAYMASLPESYGKGKRTSNVEPAAYYPEGEAPSPRSATGYIVRYPEYGNTVLIVAPPTPYGTGGGAILMCLDYYSFNEVDYEGDSSFFINEFDSVRETLQLRFLYFRDLPNPYEFTSELTAVTSAINALALDFHDMGSWGPAPDYADESGDGQSTSSSGRTQNLPSELLASLNVIFANFSNGDSFSGDAILPIKARYVTGLQVATRAICGLLYVYGGHIAAEQKIWKLANMSLDSILTQVDNGFVSVAAGSELKVNWDGVLKVVGVACDGLSLLAAATGVGAPAAAVIGGVGLGVKTLDEVVDPPKPAEKQMGSFDEVMEFISTALAAFRETVLNEEQLIEDNITANLESITAYADFYDLTGFLFDDQDRPGGGGHNQITWLPSAAAEATSSMVTASTYYSDAGGKVAGTGIWDAATRPIGLGTSTTGPAQLMDDLGAKIRALLLALAAELEAGATNIDGATDLFIEAEDGFVGKLTVLENEVDLASVSQIDGGGTEVDPLAEDSGDAPVIPPLRIKSMMEIQQENYDKARSGIY